MLQLLRRFSQYLSSSNIRSRSKRIARHHNNKHSVSNLCPINKRNHHHNSKFKQCKFAKCCDGGLTNKCYIHCEPGVVNVGNNVCNDISNKNRPRMLFEIFEAKKFGFDACGHLREKNVWPWPNKPNKNNYISPQSVSFHLNYLVHVHII